MEQNLIPRGWSVDATWPLLGSVDLKICMELNQRSSESLTKRFVRCLPLAKTMSILMHLLSTRASIHTCLGWGEDG